MKGQYLILIAGHNASGKTTLANEIAKIFEISEVSNDDVRDLLKDKIAYFFDTNYSYPSEKTKIVNNIVYVFREALVKELFLANQSIVIDGGSLTKKRREENLALARYANKKVTTIIIEMLIEERELIKRLSERDAKNKNHRWVNFYQDIRKKEHQIVSKNEADYVLRFNQNNKDEIVSKLKEILQ